MSEERIGLIPAAGKGLRMGLPYPKELFPVMSDGRYKPVSQFVLENLTAAGVRHIVLVVNSTKHQLIEFFGDGHRFNCNLSYVVQEPDHTGLSSTSPGLACALDSAYHLIRGKQVFFGMADTIMEPFDVFDRVDAADRNDSSDATFILFRTDRPQECGMVHLDSSNTVLQVIDKPRESNLTTMWGAIIWRPSFTELLHTCVRDRGIVDFAEIVNYGIGSGLRFRGVYVPDCRYTDIGSAGAPQPAAPQQRSGATG